MNVHGCAGAAQAAGELRTTAILDALNETLGAHIFPDKGDGSDPRECPLCHQGRLSLKTSRFGAFIGCERYPECKYTRPVASPDAADGADISELEVTVAAMAMAVPGAAGVYALYREGRRLNPAERTGAVLRGTVRNLEEDHPLYPTRREVFTGITPRSAREHHMTPLPRRPLPAGVRYDGAVPTTVAGTAAALKDAKTMVSGVDASVINIEE